MGVENRKLVDPSSRLKPAGIIGRNPCLVAGSDGAFAEPFPRLGAVRFKAPAQRRRRRSSLSKRRPRFLARRRTGMTRLGSQVHRQEREIIARN